MLAWHAVLGAVGAGIDHDARLGIAVERDAAGRPERFLAARAQVIRQQWWFRHDISPRVANSNPPEGAEKSAQNRLFAKSMISQLTRAAI
jgi:hypothetical protein